MGESNSMNPGAGESLNKPQRRRLATLGIAGGAAILGGLGWYGYFMVSGQYRQSTNDAYVAAEVANISPRISGYVNAVLVTADQDVHAGQPLVHVDPRSYHLQADQAEAQVAVARAAEAGAQAQIRSQQQAIARARLDLESARIEAQFAATQTARYRPLITDGSETGEHLAELQSKEIVAHNKVAIARTVLQDSIERIDLLKAQIAQARAQADGAKAIEGNARTDLTSAVITAPINGRIGNKAVRIGQYVQAGTRLMSIVPLDDVYVEANFKETQLARMQIGQPVTIKVDALPGTELHGRLVSFSPATGSQFSALPPQNATGNFTKVVQRVPARIAIKVPAELRGKLVPGLSVEAIVDTRPRGDH